MELTEREKEVLAEAEAAVQACNDKELKEWFVHMENNCTTRLRMRVLTIVHREIRRRNLE